MIKEAIGMLTQRLDLSSGEMVEVMREIMEGKVTPAQAGAFLAALRMKGESVDEIAAAAQVMREKATRIEAPPGTVDTCGTGGDLSHTFNISTVAAIVVAGAGVPVAKHGNRSVSSRSGSADVLESLGVKIDIPPAAVQECLEETGFGFMFAPAFHPAMKFAIGPRREIGIRTVFNILGPLTNPAGARYQVLGVFADHLTEPMAHVLGSLGAQRAFVVHGQDGLDEITITGKTRVSELADGNVRSYMLNPADYGITPCAPEDLQGGDAEENARIALEILQGGGGPRRHIVVLNAAAALMTVGKVPSIAEGVRMAETALDSGAAMGKLEAVRRFTTA